MSALDELKADCKPLPHGQPVLEIGASSSRCLMCNGNALWDEDGIHHDSPTGVNLDRKGCGVKWEAVTAARSDVHERLIANGVEGLPDLPVVDVWGAR